MDGSAIGRGDLDMFIDARLRERWATIPSKRTMKPTTGITLPASFIVTVSYAGTEVLPTAPADTDILTVSEVAELLKCKPSSIYNLTRHRGRASMTIRFLSCGSRWACGSVGRLFSRG